MDIFTDQPGIQFYSGNYLDGSYEGQPGKLILYALDYVLKLKSFQIVRIIKEKKVEELCFETRSKYIHKTVHKFSVD